MPHTAVEPLTSEQAIRLTEDAIAIALAQLELCGSSRELSLAKTKLQEAESWLGIHDRRIHAAIPQARSAGRGNVRPSGEDDGA